MRALALAVAIGGPGLLGAAGAGAAVRSATFDAPGQTHARVCVRLASASAALRYGDGTPTGFALSNGLAFEPGECPDGTVRLDLHEVNPGAGGPFVFHRGGMRYVDAQNVKYGELAVGELVGPLPAPVPSSGGRGAPCGLSAEPAYEAAVRSIPREMHYKRPQDVAGGSNQGSSFEHYGDPGADQGDRRDVHYSYLLWSFVDVRGGGMVRTLLAPGQVVRACDVEPVEMDSWDRSGRVNGHVTARYVRTLAGSCPVYGWMVWRHTYADDGRGPVAHAAPADPAPAAEPPPAEGCPVSAPAAPPGVSTGDPIHGADGTTTLTGSVDPVGVPSSYRFELGSGAAYESSTPEGTIGSGSGTGVSAPAGALPPSTTFHYRIVATNTHGTSYGPDRVMTTPPPAVPPQPAVALSSLRVTPSAFRRARSPRGRPARVRYVLSGPASVTLTFRRRMSGMRRGRGPCRATRRTRLRRGERRCARWATVPGRVRAARPAGATSMPFGGWIGRRRLAAGRYRVEARATGVDGRVAPMRVALFTLR